MRIHTHRHEQMKGVIMVAAWDSVKVLFPNASPREVGW